MILIGVPELPNETLTLLYSLKSEALFPHNDTEIGTESRPVKV